MYQPSIRFGIVVNIMNQIIATQNILQYVSTNIFMTNGSKILTHKCKTNSTKFIQLYLLISLFLLHINERTKSYINDYAMLNHLGYSLDIR